MGSTRFDTKNIEEKYDLKAKLVAKLEGRFEDYVKDALSGLIQLLHKTYGVGVLSRTEKTAATIMRAL